jgi:hypothetical protein
MRLASNGHAARLLTGLLLASCLPATLLLAGCHRSTLVPSAAPFTSQPARATWQTPAPTAPAQPMTRKPVSHPESPVLPAPPAEPTLLELAGAIARQGGIVNDLPAMANQLDASSYQSQTYQVQVVPRNSQEKADRIALEWASDARQLYTIWAYWKLPALSITRHAYYSPSKGKALKVEFTLSSLFSKSFEEPAEGFDQATLVLNEARDRHAIDVKEAHAIAKRMGYVPNKYGAAVLLDIKTYGPLWVFADMPSQTQGEPVMLVNAQTGMVTQGGEAMMLAKYLFQRAGY